MGRVADFFRRLATRPAPASRPPEPSLVVPPDSPVLYQMRVQREFDSLHRAREVGGLFAGGDPLAYAWNERQRRATADLIDRVDRGEPITERDLIRTVGADGDVSDAESMRLWQAHADAKQANRGPGRGGRREQDSHERDAHGRPPRGFEGSDERDARAKMRDAMRDLDRKTDQRETGDAVPDAEPTAPAGPRRRSATASRNEERIAPIADWLIVPSNDALTVLRRAAAAMGDAPASIAYQAHVVAWARTMAGEGTLNPSELPPLMRSWLAEDEAFRATGQLRSHEVSARAAAVDALSASNPRAAAQMRPVMPRAGGRNSAKRAPATSSEATAAAPRPTWSILDHVRRFGGPFSASVEPAALAAAAPAASPPEVEVPVTPTSAHARSLTALDPVPGLDAEGAADPAFRSRADALADALSSWSADDELPPVDFMDAPAPGETAAPALAPRVQPVASEVVAAALEPQHAGPRVWVNGVAQPGAFLIARPDGVTILQDGEERAVPGTLSRHDGPAVEAADPMEDRYYLDGKPQPLRLPPMLYADREFRAALFPAWRRQGFPVEGSQIAAALVATWRSADRDALFERVRASDSPRDREWLSVAVPGHGRLVRPLEA